MSDKEVVAGDTSTIYATATDSAGNVVPGTGLTATLYYRLAGGPIQTKLMTYINPVTGHDDTSAGIVYYTFALGETQTNPLSDSDVSLVGQVIFTKTGSRFTIKKNISLTVTPTMAPV